MSKLMVLAVSAALLSPATWAQGKIEKGAYLVDPAHSKVGFEIPHLVISTVEGRFTSFEGQIDVADAFEKSKVRMTAEIKSIDTSNQKRDDHLRSADFFDVAKYPTMSFESTQIKGTPQKFSLTGKLTIRGITKVVTFDGKYLGLVKDGYGAQKAVFTAKAKINRKDFGLTWSNMVEAGPVVGDEVTIDLSLQAAKK